ncbi:TPA: hypothetical protein ME922_001077 [Klebsiella pneumoniae]|nr:hypothetical protein [Klebsiella pneumoniae]HBW4576286.1 hypothetical protein [Klebsiella pneumoniae]HBW4681125.1 hypothetical protein [Klebsiella pneumoniae]HBW4830958.1 hypothetical protein [Klebsiella pneumoniae]HBW4880151.1 hypothetical protein [Klebsiella pneumoniae]
MDIGSLISTLSSISTLGKALIDERDRQILATLQIDLSYKIIEAQSQFIQLHSTVIEQQRSILTLEERIRELEATGAEKARYQLTKLGTDGEFFAYALRPESELPEGINEVAHFLCQPCFDAGKKVVLAGNGDGYWRCHICNHGAQVTPSRYDGFSTGHNYDIGGY